MRVNESTYNLTQIHLSCSLYFHIYNCSGNTFYGGHILKL